MDPMTVAVAKRGFLKDPCCGDLGSWWETETHIILFLSDGLGHGPDAETASLAARDYVAAHLSDPLPRLFSGCNEAIRRTRGVAMSIVSVDKETGRMTYAGIGNTWGIAFTGGKGHHLMSDYGIVGGGFRKLRPENLDLSADDMVLLASDGITERLDGKVPPRFQTRDLKFLAEEILSEWGRQTDDAAVLLYRHREH